MKDANSNTIEWSLTNTAASGKTVPLEPWSSDSGVVLSLIFTMLGVRILCPTSSRVSTKYFATYLPRVFPIWQFNLIVGLIYSASRNVPTGTHHAAGEVFSIVV